MKQTNHGADETKPGFKSSYVQGKTHEEVTTSETTPCTFFLETVFANVSLRTTCVREKGG
jgi:hypothetical protein